MFKEESVYLRAILSKLLEKSKIISVLDVGSSTLTFRTKIQPFIEENIFSLLKTCQVYHLDAKAGEGIDIVLDATELFTLNMSFDLVICTNLLEHVTDIGKTVIGLAKVTKNDGYLLITVPYKYIYHADPIDNFFRPSENDLSKLFSPFFTPILLKNIEINELKMKERVISLVKYMVKKETLRFNILHLTGKFKVTIALFKKNPKLSKTV